MNLADYLSELLSQYEEVSVPGLGYFVRERVNGYYSDKDSKFYPPYHKVKFVAQPKDDDLFTQYVADKKNISLASSKYFAEKFVSKLKEQALTGKYLFADLGLFYTSQDHLLFKANEKIADDPAFYGYPPVNIYKQAQQPSAIPASAEPAANPVFISKPVTAQPQENDSYFEEEIDGSKRKINVWFIVLIAIAAVALAIFGVYKFYPEAFNKVGSAYYRMTSKADTVVPVYRHEVKALDTAKADTVKKQVPAKDTVNKTAAVPTPAATADTAKHPRYEIIVSSVKRTTQANIEITRLKNSGVTAKVVTDAPGKRKKISAGTFANEADADAAMKVLEKAGKINKKSYILPINN